MKNRLGLAAVVLLGIPLCGAESLAQTECSQGCVTTHAYDSSRDNVNPNESKLKARTIPATLTVATSGNLMGAIYAQPLYVSQITINSATVNAVFVATEENYVYALDGDSSTLAMLWMANLNQANETAVPDAQLPAACDNIAPEVGITGTPVIDVASTSSSPNVLYVISKEYNTNTGAVTQRLNALSITTGMPVAPPALDIPTAFAGRAITFSATNQNQRAGLALGHDANQNPLIYAAWGSHCDSGSYTGLVAVFTLSAGSLSLVGAVDTEGGLGNSPLYPDGGIWMSGGAPAVDDAQPSPSNDVFLATGNGGFQYGVGYGESVVRFHYSATQPSLTVAGFYTPNAWSILNSGSSGPEGPCSFPLNLPPPYATGTQACAPPDFDLGSGGVTLARPQGSGFLPSDANFIVLAGGKEGVFYVIDPSKMNNTGPDTADPCGTLVIQCFAPIQFSPLLLGAPDDGNRGTTAFWPGNSTNVLNVLYVAGSQDALIRGYQMTASGGGVFSTSLYGSASVPNHSKIGYPGSSPVVTWNSNGGFTTDAILWILITSGYQNGINGSAASHALLYAYHALPGSPGGTFNLTNFQDIAHGPGATKFMVPTVINGHIYVAGQQLNSACTTTCSGLVVSWH